MPVSLMRDRKYVYAISSAGRERAAVPSASCCPFREARPKADSRPSSFFVAQSLSFVTSAMVSTYSPPTVPQHLRRAVQANRARLAMCRHCHSRLVTASSPSAAKVSTACKRPRRFASLHRHHSVRRIIGDRRETADSIEILVDNGCGAEVISLRFPVVVVSPSTHRPMSV